MNRLQILIIILLLPALSVYAQQFEQTHVVFASITGLSREVNDTYVRLNYELPYTGMVILEVRDEKDQKIWQGQKLQSKGKNFWQLNRSAFKEAFYILIIRYKNSENRIELNFPGNNHPISEMIYFDFRNIFVKFCKDPIAQMKDES